MKRVGVRGTFVWDTLWTAADLERGYPFESWGGIAYSLAAAAATLPEGWEVVPLARLGADLEPEARAYLDTLPGVMGDTPSLRVVPEPNNRVELRYADRERRGERLTGGVSEWPWNELEPHLVGLDALYVNFISGFEMELVVAERLRAAFAGPLYADLHALFLGCPGAGPRTPRPLAEWERWAACFDVVQINHDELRLLGLDGDDWSARLAPLLRAGPRMVAVTLGPGGAVVATAAGNQPVARVYPTQLSAEGDPTGCGDIWGATFFLSLLGGRTVEQGVTRAHAAAARKLLHRGATGVYPHLAQPLG